MRRKVRPPEFLRLRDEEIRQSRSCVNCGSAFSVAEFLQSSPAYFALPYGYAAGCVTHCLNCWLGCGPEHPVLEGAVLRECGLWLRPGVHLAVMPVAGIVFGRPARCSGHAIFYPPGCAEIGSLGAAGDPLDLEAFEHHALIAFPMPLDWEAAQCAGGADELLRSLAEAADEYCLNLVRYRHCSLGVYGAVPFRAGPGAAAGAVALLYNAASRQARIVEGMALALPASDEEDLEVTSDGLQVSLDDSEVGRMAQHALALYSALLACEQPTARLMQALALLNFLEDPAGIFEFENLKVAISHHLARAPLDASRLGALSRESAALLAMGYGGAPTRLRFDEMMPDPAARRQLLAEFERQIRLQLDHMLAHADLDYETFISLPGPSEPIRPC